MLQAREINLIPYDVISMEKTHGRIRMWVMTISLLIIVLAGVYLLEKRGIASAAQHITSLSLKKSAIEEKIEQLRTLQGERARLAKKEMIIKTLMHKRSLSFIFSEVEQAMNKNVLLTDFLFTDPIAPTKNLADGTDSDEWVETGYFIVKKDREKKSNDSEEEELGVKASIQGIAKTNIDLARFLKNLSKSLIFSEVNLKYSREETYDSLRVVEFDIETYLTSDI